MKKVMQFTMPFIVAGMILGMLYYLVGKAQASVALTTSAVGSILVTTLEDELNDDDDCSLREAITAANTNAPSGGCATGSADTDTITFDVEGIITVTSQLEIEPSGPLSIDGGGNITLSGGDTTRIIYTQSGSKTALSGLSLIKGEEFYGSGIQNDGTLVVTGCTFAYNRGWAGLGINNAGIITVTNSLFDHNGIAYNGAAFANGGTMTVINSVISNNAGGIGGAIGNGGSLTIINTSVLSNTADYGAGIYNSGGHLNLIDSGVAYNHVGQQGGGILNTGSGHMTILDSTIFSNTSDNVCAGLSNDTNGIMEIGNSTISDNSTEWMGGGICNAGTLNVTWSTISGNLAGLSGYETYGGGIQNSGNLMIFESTLSNNYAFYGAGIYDYGKMTIDNSTIADNLADDTSGIYIDYSGVLTITSSILDNNTGSNCNAPLNDAGYNISSDVSCGLQPAQHSLSNTNPRLGPLEDNGGPTWTHALLWGSPAIDGGDNAICPASDQRGMPRPKDGNGDGIAVCDVGAYELQEPIILPYKIFLPLISKSP